jgi:hypothetical protein
LHPDRAEHGLERADERSHGRRHQADAGHEEGKAEPEIERPEGEQQPISAIDTA